MPFNEVVKISTYVAGQEHGLARLKEGFPLSCRLLREIHGRLLARGRGDDRVPGEFRRSQNWIGETWPSNALFGPPPPVLMRAAPAHVQLATIHPFLDGNGRLGRLLIVLMLIGAGVLTQPLLRAAGWRAPGWRMGGLD